MIVSGTLLEKLRVHHLMSKEELPAVAVTIEELGELVQVLGKYIRYAKQFEQRDTHEYAKWRDTLVVELSDVLVTTTYVKEHFNISDKEIEQRILAVIEKYKRRGGDVFG